MKAFLEGDIGSFKEYKIAGKWYGVIFVDVLFFPIFRTQRRGNFHGYVIICVRLPDCITCFFFFFRGGSGGRGQHEVMSMFKVLKSWGSFIDWWEVLGEPCCFFHLGLPSLKLTFVAVGRRSFPFGGGLVSGAKLVLRSVNFQIWLWNWMEFRNLP